MNGGKDLTCSSQGRAEKHLVACKLSQASRQVLQSVRPGNLYTDDSVIEEFMRWR